MLVAFRSPSPLAGLKELPSRLQVGKWGRNVTGKGDGFTVNETTVATLPRLQAAMSYDTVALDFQHNTVSQDGKPVAEPQKVAAHGKPRVVPGEGLFIEDLKWTTEGSEAALGGHFPDLSPAVKMNDAGEVIFMHSAALCRQGSVMDLQLFSAALSTEQLRIFSATTPATTPTMDYKKLCLMLLGLAETATDLEIESGAKTFSAKIADASKVAVFAAQMKDIDLSKFATFGADLKKLSDANDALVKRLDAQERAAITAEAVGLGKIVPFGADIDALSNAQLKALVSSLEAGRVPLEQRTPEKIKTFSATSAAAASSGVVTDVQKALGISGDTWKKHNPAA